MSERVVADASALVALLVGYDRSALWATRELRSAGLVAPSAIAYEVANALRGWERAGRLSREAAGLAHADLLALPIDLWSFATLAPRAWELRHNLTSYDASYVALAELLEAPLVTLDRRLAAAPGVRCEIRTPDD